MKVRKRFCVKPSYFMNNLKPFCAQSFFREWKRSEPIKLFYPSPSKKLFCDGSFHESIYPVLFVAQFFGLLPVTNISGKSPSDLQFSWKSFRCFFAVFVTLSCGLESVFTIIWTFRTHIEFGKLVILVYYVTNFLSFCCFLNLARTWPRLMMRWHDVEKSLPEIEEKSKRREMLVRLRKTAAIILTLSALEHILSKVSSVLAVLDCPRIHNVMEAVCVHNYPQVFSFFEYNHVLGVYVKFIHVTSTFVWSFTDLFIIMISCGLSAKFKQVNDRLMSQKGKVNYCLHCREIIARFASSVTLTFNL